jgi:hypothetical protein
MKHNFTTILYLFIACNLLSIHYFFGQNKLHIVDDTGIVYRSSSGTSVVSIDTVNGRVGVNIEAPSQTLEVVGTVLIRSGESGSDIITIRDQHPYKLWVEKGTVSEDYFITRKEKWPDYVFKKDYDLMNLNKLKVFIDKNQHLPGIPSAKKVSEDGYSQHKINVKYLEKIEELVLYTIAQESRIDELITLVGDQQKMLKELKAIALNAKSKHHEKKTATTE